MGRIRFVGHILPLGAVLLLIGLLYLIPTVRFTVTSIDRSVEANCSEADATDMDRCVEALTALLRSDKVSFERKNRAIWTIGQLADPRALPVLEELRTDIPCEEPCSKDLAVCQYELEKAIGWCRGEAWLMRAFRQALDSPW